MVIKLNFVQTLSTRFGQYFEVRVQGRFSIFPLMFCRGYDVESRSRFKALFGRNFEVYVQSRCRCLVEILKLMLGRDS